MSITGSTRPPADEAGDRLEVYVTHILNRTEFHQLCDQKKTYKAFIASLRQVGRFMMAGPISIDHSRSLSKGLGCKWSAVKLELSEAAAYVAPEKEVGSQRARSPSAQAGPMLLNIIRGAQGHRVDGKGGIDGTAGGEDSRPRNKQVADIVRLAVAVDYGGGRIAPHHCAAKVVHADGAV